MATKAHLEGNARHAEKLDSIRLQPYREEGQRIRAAAAQAGETLSGYVLQAVRERMQREQAAGGTVPGPGDKKQATPND